MSKFEISILKLTFFINKSFRVIFTLISAIKDQFCNPCNKNLCFIKPKQVLNGKVHNLGKKPLSSYFGRFLYAGIYCTNKRGNDNDRETLTILTIQVNDREIF